MTDIGAIMHCHDAKKDANSFDNLMNEFKSIKRDKKIIQDMELSDEAKQKCFEDLDKQLLDVKEYIMQLMKCNLATKQRQPENI